MKIKQKIMFIFVIAIILFCGLCWFFQNFCISPTYYKIETTEANYEVLRCANAINSEIDSLKSIVSELSKSMEIKQMLQKQNSGSPDLKFISYFKDCMIFDFFFVIDNSNNIIFKELPGAGQKENKSSELLVNYILQEILQFKNTPKLESGISGLMSTSHGIVLVAVNRVQDTAGAAMVAGKFFTSNDIQKISKNLGTRFNIQHIDKSVLNSPAINKALESIKGNRSIYIQDSNTDDSQLNCYTLFPDINRKLNFLISVQAARTVFLDANSSLNLYLFAGGLFGILLLILISIFIHMYVVWPIVRLDKRTVAIRESKVLSNRIKYETRKDEIGHLAKEFDTLLDQVQNLIESMEETIRSKTVEVRTVRDDIIRRLSIAIENKERGISGHSTRVSRMAYLLAEKLQIPKSQCELISLASIMHDIGKIGLPESLLTQDGKYSEEEYKAMKAHTIIGADIFSNDESELMKTAYKIALYHHEHFDGTGYPEGLKNKNIPIEAKITTIVDIFDSLLTDKTYRKSWTLEKIAEYLKENSGTLFDPDIIKVFLANLPDFIDIKKNCPDKL